MGGDGDEVMALVGYEGAYLPCKPPPRLAPMTISNRSMPNRSMPEINERAIVEVKSIVRVEDSAIVAITWDIKLSMV